jgi:hypothetical protein
MFKKKPGCCKYFATPHDHLPQAKWTPAAGFIHSLSLVQRKKGLKAGPLSLSPPHSPSAFSFFDSLTSQIGVKH